MDPNDRFRISSVAYFLITIATIILITAGAWVQNQTFAGAVQVSSILTSLGSTILSIALVSIIYQYAVNKKLTDSIKEKLVEVVTDRFVKINRLEASGIDDAYLDFPLDEVKRRFKNAKRRIVVIQTWFPEASQLETPISSALHNGCKVEIFLVAPDCDQAYARNTDLYFASEDTVKVKVEDGTGDLQRAFSNHPSESRFTLAYYKGTPVMPIYLVDDHFFVGFFTRGKDSAKVPHFSVRGAGSTIGSLLYEHIDCIRKESIPVEMHNPAVQGTAGTGRV